MPINDLLLLSHPIILCSITFCFLVIWSNDRDYQAVRVIFKGFLFAMPAVPLQAFLMPNLPVAINAMALGFMAYFLSKVGEFISLRTEGEIQKRIFLYIGIAGITATLAGGYLFPGFNVKIATSLFCTAALVLVLCWINQGSELKTTVDKCFCWICRLISFSCVMCGIYIITTETQLTAQNFYETNHWLIINIMCALTTITFSFTLFATFVTDLFSRFKSRLETDSLSGLLMRGPFEKQVEVIVTERRTSLNTGMYVLMIDIDHFKAVNDNFGHAAGDKVIRQVGKHIADSVRKSDLVGRIGGEEFCVLLRHISREDAQKVAEKIRKTIKSQIFEELGDNRRCTISIGAAKLQSYENTADVYKRADKMLYAAKQQGRDRVIFDSETGCVEREEGVKDVGFGLGNAAPSLG